MNFNVPAEAGKLLDYIQSIEAPRGYDTVYGNNQGKLPKPLTTMTVAEVLASQEKWKKKPKQGGFGSSAAGGLQIMQATLRRLVNKLGFNPDTLVFSKGAQHWLGYELLKERGYAQFMAGSMSVQQFGLNLAKEWASFPVLHNTKGQHRTVKRGESYYAGDKLNKSLIKPAAVEKVLYGMLGKRKPLSTTTKAVTAGGAVVGAGGAVVVGTQDAQTTLDQITPITDTIGVLGSYGPYIAGGVVALVVLGIVAAALYKWARN